MRCRSTAGRRSGGSLARDGRVGYAQLAVATGWSASAVARRITELRGRGALPFEIDVEPRLFGAGRESMMWLTVDPAALDTAGEALSRHPDVAFAAVTTGATTIVAYVACADDDALYERVLLPVGRIAGVRHVDLAPVARQVTRSGPVPSGARTPA